VVAVALILLFLPGVVAALLLRAPWLAALALGPALTTTTIVLIGVTSSAAGVPWGPGPLIIGILAAWLIAAGCGALLTRYSPPEIPDRLPVTVLIVTALAAVAVALILVPVSQSPEAFPQQPDTIFHLGAAQWMVEHKDISVLHGSGFVYASTGGFYQAAFHAIVATIVMLTGASVVVSTSCFLLVIAGVVWPLGCIFLARTLFGPTLAVTLSACVVSVAFTAYPFLLMGYGVLWPNLFGQTLLPGALALLAVVLSADHRQSPSLTSKARAMVLVLATVPVLFVAHPNAFVTFLVFGYLMAAGVVLGWAWDMRTSRPRRAVASVVGLAVATGLGLVVTTFVGNPNMRGTTAPGAELSHRAALSDTLLFAPRNTAELWVLAAVVAIGAGLVLVRHGGRRWLVAALVITSAMFYLNVAVDNHLVRLFTWPWNNQSPRLSAIAVLPALLLATAALAAGAELLQKLVGSQTRAGLPQWTSGVAVPLLFVLATGGAYVAPHRRALDPFFHPKPSRSWVNSKELAALHSLGRHVPPDAVVAANAWNGGTYMYVVSGRHMLFPTEKSLLTRDRILLALRLDDVGRSPQVCAAARRQHVGYALTGGSLTSAGKRTTTQYAGVDAVGSSGAFREVATAGPYTLYRLVACASS